MPQRLVSVALSANKAVIWPVAELTKTADVPPPFMPTENTWFFAGRAHNGSVAMSVPAVVVPDLMTPETMINRPGPRVTPGGSSVVA